MPAQVVDTTGAGDTFVGVLAAALAERLPVLEAVRRGVAAGALAVERLGAVPSIPTRDETTRRLAGA
jgi:ribokinase